MEPAPVIVPAPAIVQGRAKPVVIRPPEVNSAHDTAIIAWILVLLYTLPGLVIFTVIGVFGVLASPWVGYLLLPPAPSTFPFIGFYINYLIFYLPASWFIYLGLGAVGLIVGLIFILLVYLSTVRNINVGRYEKARGWSLLWAVLFIIPIFLVLAAPAVFFPTVLLLLPAFFYFLTYGRLGEVIAKYGPIAVLGEAVPGVGMASPALPVVGGPPPMMAGPPPMMGGPPPPMLGGPPYPPPGPMPGQAGPRAPPMCPTCGRELYYQANHRRWYCPKCDNPSGL